MSPLDGYSMLTAVVTGTFPLSSLNVPINLNLSRKRPTLSLTIVKGENMTFHNQQYQKHASFEREFHNRYLVYAQLS